VQVLIEGEAGAQGAVIAAQDRSADRRLGLRQQGAAEASRRNSIMLIRLGRG
jgi:hypothetical protein